MNPDVNNIGISIDKKLGGVKCPYCKTRKSYISSVYGLPNNDQGKYNDLNQAVATPYVVFTCDTCGHTDFFNPNRLGLI